MTNIGTQLTTDLGYSPFSNPKLLQFDKQILLATAHILPLPLNDVFFTCYYIHGMRHSAGQNHDHHHHDSIVEMHHCLEGEYSIEVAGQPPLVLHPGAGVIIAPGLSHQTQCIKEGVRLTARAEINGPHAVQFSQELAKQAAGQLITCNDQSLDMVIYKLFKALLDDSPNTWRYEIAGGLIRIWLGTILATCFDFSSRTQYALTNDVNNNRGHALAERASAFIHANFQRQINLNEIAAHTGITARHLNRLFKQYVGTSVNQTLRDVRLAEAFRILSGNGKSSIKETAYRTGFSSPSYFTQCFKQQYGILPTEVHLKLSQPFDIALKRINEYRQITNAGLDAATANEH